ncbi:hypothetical protein Tco_1565140 [Tanacetum coccineum]
MATLQETVSQKLQFPPFIYRIKTIHSLDFPAPLYKTKLKDFKAKYKKVKAKLALLSPGASASSSTLVKNKGLIAETCELDEEDVSSDDNEVMEVKALMPLAEEERVSVSKQCARNGEWVQISIIKVPTWYLQSWSLSS